MQIAYAFWRLGSKWGCCSNVDNDIPPPKTPASVLRRLTPLGRDVLDALSKAPKTQMSWVISSQHGDLSRMIELFEDLHHKTPVSPTHFGMSVHNAIIASFSMATQNQNTHTALAGGKHSFQLGLLEAISLCKEKNDWVGYIYYDSPPPSIYRSVAQGPKDERIFLLLIAPHTDIHIDNRISIDIENTLDNFIFSIYELAQFFENNDRETFIPFPGGRIKIKKHIPTFE